MIDWACIPLYKVAEILFYYLPERENYHCYARERWDHSTGSRLYQNWS